MADGRSDGQLYRRADCVRSGALHGDAAPSPSTRTNDKGVVDYVLERDRVVLAFTTKRHFLDVSPPAERRIAYRLRARDVAADVSRAAVAEVDVHRPHGI